MTVKVNRDSLVVAIQAKRAEVIAEHAKQVKASAGEFVKYKQIVQAKTMAFLKKVNSAKTAEDIQDGLQYGSRLEFSNPPKITSEPNTHKYDRALAQLALVVDPIVTLNEKNDGDFLSLI